MLTLMRMVQEQNGVPGRMQAMGGTEHRILPRALICLGYGLDVHQVGAQML
jgi:hypothetical protein